MLKNNFPLYHQLDAMDCGSTCLRMVAKYYGRHFSLYCLANTSNFNKERASVLGICGPAEKINCYYLIKNFKNANIAPSWVTPKTKAQRIIWNLASAILDSTKSFVAVLLNSFLISSRKILISLVIICCLSSTVFPPLLLQIKQTVLLLFRQALVLTG